MYIYEHVKKKKLYSPYNLEKEISSFTSVYKTDEIASDGKNKVKLQEKMVVKNVYKNCVLKKRLKGKASPL